MRKWMESTQYWETKEHYEKRVQWVFYSFIRTTRQKKQKTRYYQKSLLSVFERNMQQSTKKIYLFCNVILILHIGWFASVLAFFYVKQRKDTFSVNLFSIPKEYFHNFGILVPMKMNKKKNYFILFFFLYKECYLWVLAFLVLKELENTHNTRFS